MNKYKELRGKRTQETAAAKTGISVSSARRIESSMTLPSQRPPRRWRTRADPLREIWEAEVVPMLSGAPTLMAVTVLPQSAVAREMRVRPGLVQTLLASPPAESADNVVNLLGAGRLARSAAPS